MVISIMHKILVGLAGDAPVIVQRYEGILLRQSGASLL